jgi:hypothetical protein
VAGYLPALTGTVTPSARKVLFLAVVSWVLFFKFISGWALRRSRFLAHPLFLAVVFWCCFLNSFFAFVSYRYAVVSGFTERFGGRARIDGISGMNTGTTGVLKQVLSFLSPMISPKTVFWFCF